MKIKVADSIFTAKPDQPIMVILEELDKQNIANMHPDATKYACFHKDEIMDVEEKKKWMRKLS